MAKKRARVKEPEPPSQQGLEIYHAQNNASCWGDWKRACGPVSIANALIMLDKDMPRLSPRELLLVAWQHGIFTATTKGLPPHELKKLVDVALEVDSAVSKQLGRGKMLKKGALLCVCEARPVM